MKKYFWKHFFLLLHDFLKFCFPYKIKTINYILCISLSIGLVKKQKDFITFRFKVRSRYKFTYNFVIFIKCTEPSVSNQICSIIFYNLPS